MQQWLRRCAGVALLGVALLVLGLAPLATVTAATMEGEVIKLDGLNSLTATGMSQVKGNTGKFTGVGLSVAGMGTAALGAWAIGAIAALAGFGVAFAPGIYSQAVDSAPAATADLLHQAQGLVSTDWWAPLTIVPYLGQVLLSHLANPVSLALVVSCLLLVQARRSARVAV